MANLKNDQSDEALRSGQITGVMACLLGLGLFLAPLLVNTANSDARRHEARLESLAYQAFEIHQQSLKTPRGPASEASVAGQGQVGLGPDGKPYAYHVTDDKTAWLVQVWSEASSSRKTEVRIEKDQL